MSKHIGLYIGIDRLACVLITKGGLAWHGLRDRGHDVSLHDDLEQLLEGIRIERFARPVLYTSVGPALAQVKELRGLPAVDSPRVIRQVIEESPSRFFLTGDSVQLVAEPFRSPDGWWASVADATSVSDVSALCLRRGWRNGGVRPVSAVLNCALSGVAGNDTVTWTDGPASVAIKYEGHRLVTLSRTRRVAENASDPTSELAPPLRTTMANAWPLAGAYAAAQSRNTANLSFQLRREGNATPRNIVRRAASILAVALGAIVMLASPGIVAGRIRSQNEASTDALKSLTLEAAKDRYATQQTTATVRQVRSFVATRRLLTPLLSSLSTQLPESTAIVALRLDTLGGTLVTLSPRGASIVAAIGGTADVDGLQLSAPITREQVGPTELQRMAVRFRFKRTGPSAPATRK